MGCERSECKNFWVVKPLIELSTRGPKMGVEGKEESYLEVLHLRGP